MSSNPSEPKKLTACGRSVPSVISSWQAAVSVNSQHEAYLKACVTMDVRALERTSQVALRAHVATTGYSVCCPQQSRVTPEHNYCFMGHYVV